MKRANDSEMSSGVTTRGKTEICSFHFHAIVLFKEVLKAESYFFFVSRNTFFKFILFQ